MGSPGLIVVLPRVLRDEEKARVRELAETVSAQWKGYLDRVDIVPIDNTADEYGEYDYSDEELASIERNFSFRAVCQVLLSVNTSRDADVQCLAEMALRIAKMYGGSIAFYREIVEPAIAAVSLATSQADREWFKRDGNRAVFPRLPGAHAVISGMSYMTSDFFEAWRNHPSFHVPKT